MKLFGTNNTDTVRQREQFFNFELPSPSTTVINRAAKFQSLFDLNSLDCSF